jgi:hypothetical protein
MVGFFAAVGRLMMELRRLKYMSVLAEELHFGKAAERRSDTNTPLPVHVLVAKC